MSSSPSQARPLQRLLWESDAPSKDKRRAPLTLGRIVDGAVKLADQDGLDAVSMNRIAQSLGFSPMALYRHVANKDDLVVLMVNRALRPTTDADHDLSGDWRNDLERWARDVLATLRRHPWVLRVPITGPPATPSQLAWLDRGLRALAGTALTEAEKAATILLLNGHVFWGARLFVELDRIIAAEHAPANLASMADALADVIDAGRYPALSQAIDAGIFNDNSTEQDFTFGLHRILDGIEHLLSTPAAEAPPTDAPSR